MSFSKDELDTTMTDEFNRTFKLMRYVVAAVILLGAGTIAAAFYIALQVV